MSEFFDIYGNLIVSMLFAAILALSLYLPLMAGQLSLASPGFYALGGYIAAILSTKVFISFSGDYPILLIILEILIACVICSIIAVAVGILVLRLRGIYLALATIALVEVLRILSQTLDITGGATGIINIPRPFVNQIDYAVIVGPLLLLCIFFVARLERTRVGRAFTALREDELAASAMGINPTYYKVLAFTLGAILAGGIGAVSAHFLNTWNPRQGTFDNSILYLTFVLIGGSETFAGPVIGAMALTALPELLRSLAGVSGFPVWLTKFLTDGRLIIYGVLIAVGAVFFPRGLITPELLSRLNPFRRRLPPPLDSVPTR